MTRPGTTSPDIARATGPARVAILNHHRDDVRPLAELLRTNGYVVEVEESLAATQRRLDEEPPDVAVLNPLLLEPGCVELELLERLQENSQPVPLILLVDQPQLLRGLWSPRLPLCDFVRKAPGSATLVDGYELLQRLELATHHRACFVRLHERAVELEGQVSVDFKTQLLSERYFRQVLELEFKRARRHQTPLSLLLLDVDDFKSVNDSTDYAFGDEVLRHVAGTLARNIRETDFAARFGGDEFVLLLPHTTPAEAVQTAMRVRTRIARETVRNARYRREVTVSIGIDTFDGRQNTTPVDLRRRANLALQKAKRRGKNQVWLFADELDDPIAAALPEEEIELSAPIGSDEPRREAPSRPADVAGTDPRGLPAPRRTEPRRRDDRERQRETGAD
ncbi:MAG: GGDEF domain-containing protein [Planctomycetes bacterium]|nr:GGDEF domain-containing protein [Planctomycetota bacterium]